MAGISFHFSDGNRSKAQMALEEAEDRLMELDEHEGTDLSYHVKKEAERTRIFIWQNRELRGVLQQKTDRLMIIVLVGFGVLFIQGTINVQGLATMWKLFFK